MKYARISVLLTFVMVEIAGAQTIPCPANPQAADTSGRADLVIRASASAESIRFDTQPRVEVRLTGCAELDTVRVLERRNLPDPVQPGVTYRNVYVATEILGHLNVECLLAGIGGVVGQPVIAGGPSAGAGQGNTAPTPGQPMTVCAPAGTGADQDGPLARPAPADSPDGAPATETRPLPTPPPSTGSPPDAR